MTFNLKTLAEIQTAGWPRWGNGQRPSGLRDAHIHMFFLEPIRGVPFPKAGRRVAACQFAPGGKFIEADHSDRSLGTSLCDHCVTVVVQLSDSASSAP